MEAVLKKTKDLLVPTATPTALPTIVPSNPSVPEYHVQSAGGTGHSALWVVTVIMALSSITFYAMAARVPVQKRLFHVLTAFITTIAFISYFAMATGDGLSLHTYNIKESSLHIVTKIYQREIYWARYVDWTLTTPLLLLDLGFLAGLSGSNLIVTIFADVIMILTGLFAAYGQTEAQKWGYYTIGCIAYLAIIYQLAVNGRTAVANKDNRTKTFFTLIAGYTLLLWTAYPIVWGIGDGALLVGVDTEIVAYAILDVLAKPGFGFWLLFTHDRNARSSPSIDGFWANGITSEGAIRINDD